MHSANQRTDFYMIGTSAMKKLNINLKIILIMSSENGAIF